MLGGVCLTVELISSVWQFNCKSLYTLAALNYNDNSKWLPVLVMKADLKWDVWLIEKSVHWQTMISLTQSAGSMFRSINCPKLTTYIWISLQSPYCIMWWHLPKIKAYSRSSIGQEIGQQIAFTAFAPQPSQHATPILLCDLVRL